MIHFSKKGIKSKTIWIKSGSHRIPLLILFPKDCSDSANQSRTGVLWIHGGGYMVGMKEMAYMGRAADLVKNHGAVVISPGYHLSLFHPYPTALEECYDALLYMKNHSQELGINRNQIMVGGESAGGGLTASLCMLARDRGEVKIAFQMPLYPMIDNFDTETSKDNHAKVWNTKKNHLGWKLYLRKDYKKEVSPYASPARQKDFSNLPPAYTFVCTAEPFYDETMTFIKNLNESKIEAKVDVYPGMYHAFDMLERDNPVSIEAIKKFNEYFSFAQKKYFATE